MFNSEMSKIGVWSRTSVACHIPSVILSSIWPLQDSVFILFKWNNIWRKSALSFTDFYNLRQQVRCTLHINMLNGTKAEEFYILLCLSLSVSIFVSVCFSLFLSLCLYVFLFSDVCDWPVCRISQVGFHRWSQGGQLWSASPPSCWQVEADMRRTPSLALPLSHAETDTHQTDLQADTGPTLAWRGGGGRGGGGTWWTDRQTDRKFIRKSHLNRLGSVQLSSNMWLSWLKSWCLGYHPAIRWSP